MDSYRLLIVELQDGVACVRLKKSRLDETEVQLLADELLLAANQSAPPRAALSLGGPQTPECMYSVFLAKLIAIRNALRRKEGDLVLVEVGEVTYSVFEACHLHKEFVIRPDFGAALRHFQASV